MTYQHGTFDDNQFILAKLPSWVSSSAGETPNNVAFLSGATFASLDALLTQTGSSVPQKLLRNTLAFKAAASTSKLEGRMSREADIRDAYHLTPLDREGVRHWGPDGEVLAFWRDVVRLRLREKSYADQLSHLCSDAEQAGAWLNDAFSEAERIGTIPAAVMVMRTVLDWNGRAERLACCLADIVTARSFAWDDVLPLTALHLTKSDLRNLRDGAGGADARVQLAITKSGQFAFGVARNLAKQKSALMAVAPKLRARGSEDAIALFLSEDTVSPSGMLSPVIKGSRSEMSARNARRLCDRLVELGVVKELTGRPTFRLYGVTP